MNDLPSIEVHEFSYVPDFNERTGKPNSCKAYVSVTIGNMLKVHGWQVVRWQGTFRVNPPKRRVSDTHWIPMVEVLDDLSLSWRSRTRYSGPITSGRRSSLQARTTARLARMSGQATVTGGTSRPPSRRCGSRAAAARPHRRGRLHRGRSTEARCPDGKRLPHARLIDLTQGDGAMAKPGSDARRFVKLEREHDAKLTRERKVAERKALKLERQVEALATKSGFARMFDRL